MAVAMLLGAVILGGGYFVFTRSGGTVVEGGPTPKDQSLGRQVSEKFNYSYDFPPGWKIDAELKFDIGSNLWAIRRTDPDAWLTLMAREYASTPRDGQMFDEFYRRMGRYFADLEYEQHPDGQLAGQRAMRFVFQGKVKNVGKVVGEAYLMFYQGIGYAMFTWSAADSVTKAAAEYDDLRLRFGLLDKRETWRDQRQPGDFHGTKLAYSLRDNQGVWKKNENYRELFQADLALEAVDPSIADARTNRAMLLVMVQGKQPDLKTAAALARTELEKEWKKDYPDTKIEVIGGIAGPLDRDSPVGNQQGHVAKLHVINDQGRQRFVVIATVLTPEATVILHGECPWERRSLWEHDFDRFISSFQLKP